MNKLYRSMLLSGILAAGLAGCGDDVTVVDPPAPVPPTPQVRSVTVAPDNVQVSPGQTIQMSAAVTADSGATPTVTWSTSDATRATVNGTGLVTVVANAPSGPVAIRATATFNSSSASGVATLNVVGTTVSGVTITPDAATITAGTSLSPPQTVQLAATVNGTNNPAQTVTWESLDPTLATVSASGVVTANNTSTAGSVVIKACSTVDTTKCGTSALTVVVPTPASVQIASITRSTGTGVVPVTLTNVFGQIEITLNIEPGSRNLTRVDALIGGQVVASQTFSSASVAAAPEAAPTQVTLSVNTAAVRQNGGIFVPVTFNGNSAVSALLYVAGASTPLASNAIPVVMNNPDAVIRTPSAALTPTSSSPSFDDGLGNIWYTGSQTVSGYHYVAFGKTVPASVTLSSSICGTSSNLVPAGATATSGIALTGTYSCAGATGANGVVGTITTTYPAGAVGPDGTPLIKPEAGAPGYGGLNTVGSAFEVDNEDRWNMINPAVGADPTGVFVDNVAPVVTPDEIGFLAGCSSTIPNPGCWISRGYNLAGDFPATDVGGTGVASTSVFDLASTGPDACGSVVRDPTNATLMPEQTSPTAYNACAVVADQLGNQTVVAGFNLYSLDATAPTIADSSVFLPANTDTIYDVVPAQVIDFGVQDNNSGLDANLSLNVAFTYLVNNGGVAVTEATPGPCAAVSTAITGAGTAPQTMVTKPAPDNGCGLPGYYYYSATAIDRAGNVSGAITKKFGYEPGTPSIAGVNVAPLYGGGQANSVTVFATHTGADLSSGMLGVWFTASGGSQVAFNFGRGFFDNIFGAPWDASLYLSTPATGVSMSLASQFSLAGVVVDTTAAPVSAYDSVTVAIRDVYTNLSTPTAAHVDTLTTVINPVFVDPTKVSTLNTTWAIPGIASPTFSGSGACTFDYATPTNGPTIPTLVWVVSEVVAGQTYDVLFALTAAPTLVSDNGIQRLYRYNVHTSSCATLAGTGTLKLVAVQNDTAGLPVGYIVP